MMTSILYVKIPSDISRALETLVLDLSADGSGLLVEDTAGDQLPSHLKKDVDEEIFTIETAPLKRMINGAQEDAEDNAGVYAYYYSSTTGSELGRLDANVRATCLAMACGLHSQRFYGDVFISRLGYYSTGVQDGVKLTNASFTAKEVEFACQTPDLRLDIIETITGISKNDISLPRWITEAARNNYEDSAALSVLASVMKTDKEIPSQHESMLGGESGYESDVGSSSDSDDEMADNSKQSSREFVTKVPLCLHCRRPSSNICPICKGAYFCASPSSCKDLGWSHKAICCTWAIYTSHRDELSTFPFAGWQTKLLDRKNQISEDPYRNYLTNDLGVLKDDEESTWWTTEISGWCGGRSDSAKKVDAIKRLSYEKGFSLDANLLPPEHPVTIEDSERANIGYDHQCSLLEINSWEEYYKLRRIPLESPAALLLTFPLTMYYALLKHGAVPITVAKMLRRQLRIHVVGVEKELNFLDLFKELGFLLPSDLNVSLEYSQWSVYYYRYDSSRSPLNLVSRSNLYSL